MTIEGTLQILGVLFGVVGSSATAFYLFRNQLVTMLKDELKLQTDRVERLQKDIDDMGRKLDGLSKENLSLLTERDYLKGIIIHALTTQKTVSKQLLVELKDSQSWSNELNIVTEKDEEIQKGGNKNGKSERGV